MQTKKNLQTNKKRKDPFQTEEDSFQRKRSNTFGVPESSGLLEEEPFIRTRSISRNLSMSRDGQASAHEESSTVQESQSLSISHSRPPSLAPKTMASDVNFQPMDDSRTLLTVSKNVAYISCFIKENTV